MQDCEKWKAFKDLKTHVRGGIVKSEKLLKNI